MNERARIITEQALSLPASEREELCRALAVSLGRPQPEAVGLCEDELSDEAKEYLKAAWDKGIASGPGRYSTIEDVIGEARRRLGERS